MNDYNEISDSATSSTGVVKGSISRLDNVDAKAFRDQIAEGMWHNYQAILSSHRLCTLHLQ